MDITFDVLLEGTKYEPSITAHRYEIAPEVWVTLRRPTYGLRKKALEKLDELKKANGSDYELVQVVAEVESDRWPEPDDHIPEVATAVAEDFFTCLTAIGERRQRSLPASSPSRSDPETSPKPDGPSPGAEETTAGKT